MIQNSTNLFGVAKWIVDPVLGAGTHQDIQSAINSASAGQTIFIRPATYSGNLTLKPGVNLTAFVCDSSLNGTGNVIINGAVFMSTAGTVTISGVQFQDVTQAFLQVTGSAASVINLINCYFLCNFISIAIAFVSSSSSSALNIYNCNGSLLQNTSNFLTTAGPSTINIYNTNISNPGLSTTPISFQGSTCNIQNCNFQVGVQTTTIGGSVINITDSTISPVGNETSVFLMGNDTVNIKNCSLGSAAAATSSALIIDGTATANVIGCNLLSSNTHVITGTGTLNYSFITFTGSSSGHNVSTENPYATLI
jgi:hypothetical protein